MWRIFRGKQGNTIIFSELCFLFWKKLSIPGEKFRKVSIIRRLIFANSRELAQLLAGNLSGGYLGENSTTIVSSRP